MKKSALFSIIAAASLASACSDDGKRQVDDYQNERSVSQVEQTSETVDQAKVDEYADTLEIMMKGDKPFDAVRDYMALTNKKLNSTDDKATKKAVWTAFSNKIAAYVRQNAGNVDMATVMDEADKSNVTLNNQIKALSYIKKLEDAGAESNALPPLVKSLIDNYTNAHTDLFITTEDMTIDQAVRSSVTLVKFFQALTKIHSDENTYRAMKTFQDRVAGLLVKTSLENVDTDQDISAEDMQRLTKVMDILEGFDETDATRTAVQKLGEKVPALIAEGKTEEAEADVETKAEADTETEMKKDVDSAEETNVKETPKAEQAVDDETEAEVEEVKPSPAENTTEEEVAKPKAAAPKASPTP